MNFRRFIIIIVIAVIAYHVLCALVGDACGGNCQLSDVIGDNVGTFYKQIMTNDESLTENNNCDENHKHCNCNERNERCAPNSATHNCGWTNSVTSDDHIIQVASENTKGQQRVFKYPHYYGYGTASGFHYGEPFYLRTVDY